ncbi:helix-hairpin-helix domain-containing protein [Myxococcota bacterium]|nr:helix-hairpin-helix domain-containing protein [Myxococcota bacterium]
MDVDTLHGRRLPQPPRGGNGRSGPNGCWRQPGPPPPPPSTGRPARLHGNSSTTEWFVAFYASSAFVPAPDLPGGFVDPHLAGPDRPYDRTPFAFPFRTRDGRFDFVLVSVHLRPGDGPSHRARRKEELEALAAWVERARQASPERDFILAGDMNLEAGPASDRGRYLEAALPDGWRSLNPGCARSTVTGQGHQCYDHALVQADSTAPADPLQVVDLRQALPPPPLGRRFDTVYSDHHPVRWVHQVPPSDADGAPPGPLVIPPAPRVDLNHATLAELDALPRIGPALARRVIAARPFTSVDDLSRVPGIGPATLEVLRPLVTVAPPP